MKTILNWFRGRKAASCCEGACRCEGCACEGGACRCEQCDCGPDCCQPAAKNAACCG